ncbi:hypothetical protein [Ideonella paludis]
MLHVLPGGTKRIRHYGVLPNGCKKTQLAQVRQALHQRAPNPRPLNRPETSWREWPASR